VADFLSFVGGNIVIVDEKEGVRELADAESWRDLETHNFPPDYFLRELADTESWRDLEPHNFPLDSF
jgi:hypothetical protein